MKLLVCPTLAEGSMRAILDTNSYLLRHPRLIQRVKVWTAGKSVDKLTENLLHGVQGGRDWSPPRVLCFGGGPVLASLP